MKKLISICLQCCFCISCFCQFNFYSEQRYTQNQAAIELTDGDFLIVAMEFDTPSSAPSTIHLVRSNATGELLWQNNFENDFPNIGQPNFSIFEHSDGHFILFTRSKVTNTCGGGVNENSLAIKVLSISSNGELLSENIVPIECNLTLRDVVQIGENTFAVLAKYDSILPVIQELLLIVDSSAEVLHERFIDNAIINAAALINADANQFQLFYQSNSIGFEIQTYDHELNIVESYFNENEEGLCESSIFEHTSFHVNTLGNDDIGVVCSSLHHDNKNTHFIRFEPDLKILHANKYQTIISSNLVESNNGDIIYASQNKLASDNSDLTLVQLNASGDSLSSTLIVHENTSESPTRLLKTKTNKLAVVGISSCCLEDSINAYSDSFLFLDSMLILNEKEPDSNEKLFLYPNPTEADIYIELDEKAHSKNLEIELFNAAGQLVLSKILRKNSTRVALNGMASGMYFYRLIDKHNVLDSGKIIKN